MELLGAESRLDLLVEGREQRLDDKRESQMGERMGYRTLFLLASDCNCISDETLLCTISVHYMPSGKKEPNISGFSFAAG